MWKKKWPLLFLFLSVLAGCRAESMPLPAPATDFDTAQEHSAQEHSAQEHSAQEHAAQEHAAPRYGSNLTQPRRDGTNTPRLARLRTMIDTDRAASTNPTANPPVYDSSGGSLGTGLGARTSPPNPLGESGANPNLASQARDLRAEFARLENLAKQLAQSKRAQYAPQHKASTVWRADIMEAPQSRTAHQNDELHQLLTKAFDARQKLLRQELQSLKQRLERLEQTLTAREKNRERIISKRIEELLSPDLVWNPEDVPARTPPTPVSPSIAEPGSSRMGAPNPNMNTPQGKPNITRVPIDYRPSPIAVPSHPLPGSPPPAPVAPMPGSPPPLPIEPLPGSPPPAPVAPLPGSPPPLPIEPLPGSPPPAPIAPLPGSPPPAPIAPLPGSPISVVPVAPLPAPATTTGPVAPLPAPATTTGPVAPLPPQTQPGPVTLIPSNKEQTFTHKPGPATARPRKESLPPTMPGKLPAVEPLKPNSKEIRGDKMSANFLTTIDSREVGDEALPSVTRTRLSLQQALAEYRAAQSSVQKLSKGLMKGQKDWNPERMQKERSELYNTLIQARNGLELTLLELETHQNVLRGNLEQAKAALDIAHRQYEIREKLHAAKTLPESELLQARGTRDEVSARVQRAEALHRLYLAKPLNDLATQARAALNAPVIDSESITPTESSQKPTTKR